jgi:acyl dehydratase
MAVNYGLNKVRFPAPVPAGSRVRMNVQVAGAEQIKGGVQLLVDATIEREGGDKPVYTAQLVLRYYD